MYIPLYPLFIISACSASIPTWERGGYDAVAPARSLVELANIRITVLGERLFRVQARKGQLLWDDRQSQAVVNRNTPLVEFTRETGPDQRISVHTQSAYLAVLLADQGSVQIVANATDAASGAQVRWTSNIGAQSAGNLFGTIRTLDELGPVSLNCSKNCGIRPHNEDLHCAFGLPSTQGWFVLNDTASPRFEAGGDWPAAVGGNGTDSLDLYVSLHGTNYAGALQSFSLITGRTAMPPRAPLDTMFCRWYDIGADDALDIAEQHALRSLPLSVLIIDMEFHGDCAGPNGWTGYTPDPHTMAPPFGFNDSMGRLQDLGLQVGLNLHDADGVYPCEERYEAFKSALRLRPDFKGPIPFNATDRAFMLALQDTVVQRLVGGGAAVQWTDWQQGGSTGVSIPGWSPTYLLNYVRSSTAARRGEDRRSWSLSRYGGVGQQRDGTLGFSGDYERSWASLRFLPYFSSTATNAYWQWTHDAAGGIPGALEFNVRWVQAASVSAMYRTHGSGIPLPGGWDWQGRYMPVIWLFPDEQYQSMRSAAVSRHEWLPLHYSLWRTQHDGGVGPLRQMYLHYPLVEDAFRNGTVVQQYMLGPDVLVSPVTSPSNSNTSLTSWSVWLPGPWDGRGRAALPRDPVSASASEDAGMWYSILHGGLINASALGSAGKSTPSWDPSLLPQAAVSVAPLQTSRGGLLTFDVDISEVPLFVRAGAVLPILPFDSYDTVGIGTRSSYPRLGARVYPGASSGAGAAYEDDGTTLAWTNTTVPIAGDIGRHADTINADFAALRGVGKAINEHGAGPAGAAWTTFEVVSRTATQLNLRVSVNGSFAGMPTARQYRIEVVSCMPPSSVLVVPEDGNPVELPFKAHPDKRPASSSVVGDWYTYDGHSLTATLLTPMLQQPQNLQYSQSVTVGTISVAWTANGGDPRLQDPGHSAAAFVRSNLQLAAGYVRRGALIKAVADKQVFPSMMKKHLNSTQLAGSAGLRLAGPAWRLAAEGGQLDMAVDDRAPMQPARSIHDGGVTAPASDLFLDTLAGLRQGITQGLHDAQLAFELGGPLASTNATTSRRALGLYRDVLAWT